MRRVAVAVFLALHGLVHGWYVVLSNGWVQAEDAMGWNGTSWLLSSLLTQEPILALASVVYAVVTIAFLAGAVGHWRRTEWASGVLLAAAILSTITLLVMWDGVATLLVEKGIVGVLINAAIVALLLRPPTTGDRRGVTAWLRSSRIK
ncbi:hypothetical protein [Halapricum hydrolyticum]|uniref:Uncharacterized protein n=1 Tax=Halapricum hydrolyticum TaxID=2979991 RepID=A0AAE3IBU8_9EURY|nr:hypothetical protein [Halapricum hydrolyticum]MCU4718733.1 hypothetical protein [Halapricum hydrolyticum]MCU4727720.1 hypothetical protein [Halapricum hydrolyticum]